MPKIKITKKKMIVSVGLGILTLLFFLMADFYFFNITKSFSRSICGVIPFPVAVVNKKDIITTRQLISNIEAIKTFYQSQDFSEMGMRIDFKTEEGKMRLKIKEKEVLDKLIENQIVENISEKFEIELTEREIKRSLEQKISVNGGDEENFVLSVRKLYNWNLDQFRNEIVIPELRLSKLYDYYIKKVKPESEAYKKISIAKKELREDKSNFEEVVKKYSEGESAQNGGELGWFKKDELIEEVSRAILNLSPGSVSDVVVSPLGYHIIFLEEIRETKEETAEETEEKNSEEVVKEGEVTDEKKDNNKKEKETIVQKEYKIRQIYTREGGFLDWLIKQKQEAELMIFLRSYEWQAKEAMVQFRSENLQKKEEEIRIRSQGDPSLVY